MTTLLSYALKTLFIVGIGATLTGCISVNLGPKTPEKSMNVAANAPSPPFQVLKGARADQAWQNPEDGNSISYLSTCNEQSDPSLEIATEEIVSGLGNTKTLSQKKSEFDGRDALDTIAEARVEGVPTKIHALVFKKNACVYTLSLIGLKKSFDRGEPYFAAFVKGFRAP